MKTWLIEVDIMLKITGYTGLLLTTADVTTDMVDLQILVLGLLPSIKFMCSFLFVIILQLFSFFQMKK